MGFLDHSRDFIYIDTVLTDRGRKQLAQNDGSFEIVKFALGDDEIDYTIIERYGISTGKDRIENYTPVLEAITNESFAQKFKLVSLSDQSLSKMPTVELASAIGGESFTAATSEEITGGVLQLAQDTEGKSSATVTIKQETEETSIDPELIDQSYVVEVDNRFVKIQGELPVSISRSQRAIYMFSRAAGDTTRGSKFSFSLRARNISSSEFTKYGTVDDKTIIRTYVKVYGVNSGRVKEFQLNIAKSSS